MLLVGKYIKDRIPLRKLFLFLLVASTLLSVASPSSAIKVQSPPPPEEALQNALVLQNAFVSAAEKVSPAVVNISTERTIRSRLPGFDEDFFKGGPFDDFFRRFFEGYPREYRQRSLGSGLAISKDGYILTNNHVIAKATKIRVSLVDGRKFDGQVVGTDPKTDLAVIKLKASNLPVAPLGDSDKIRVGEWAIAIGNPFGLDHTVTVGVISAKGRSLGVSAYEDFIQTDASINPGNSGGPLVNIKGEVIGINTAIATPTGGSVGIGFAIPINMVKNIMDDLIKEGKVVRPWIGVIIQELTPELAKQLNLSISSGVLVADVESGGPADTAGIKQGDVILEVNGTSVKTVAELQKEILKRRVGDKVNLLVFREGQKKTFTVTTQEMPSEPALARGEERAWLGIQVQAITPELARRLGLVDQEGVVITDVESDSPAEKAGLQRGDVVKEVNRIRIKSLGDYNNALKKIKPGDNVVLLIRRGKYTSYVVVETEPKG